MIPRKLWIYLGLTVLAMSLSLNIARADDITTLLTITITDANRTVLPGSTSLFSGTVMNDTGVDLSASGLFLNFSGFDPSVVSLMQVLGDIDFSIPNGTTTPPTPLFEAMLGSNAAPGQKYLADVDLQDSAGNITEAETISLQTPGAPTPEPSSILSLATGFGILMVRAQWRARRRSVRRRLSFRGWE